MRVAVTQPVFLPWLGYFDLLDKVDLFVVLDNVQLVKRSFMVRNRLFNGANAVSWYTAEIKQCRRSTLMNKAFVSTTTPWWSVLFRRMDHGYRHTPFWPEISEDVRAMLKPLPNETIAAYNLRITLAICLMIKLEMKNRWRMASAMSNGRGKAEPIHLAAQDRILSICRQLHAKSFYNFNRGVEIGLYQSHRFKAEGIDLYQQHYRHPQYHQRRLAAFEPCLSVIDLISSVGPDSALEVIRQGRHWKKIDE